MTAAPDPLHGVLARVWLAAHWDRKLSKSQLVHTDVREAAMAVGAHADSPAALRVCAQLLLGVARIYARKAKYLQDDCSDALLRIKIAFRPAGPSVDLPHEQLSLASSAITLPDAWTAWDLLMPPPAPRAWPSLAPARPSTAHTARAADITLPDTGADVHDIPEMPPIDVDDAQLDLGLENVYDPPLEPPAKRARRSMPRTPFAELSQNADDSVASIGVGRDAAAPMDDAAHVNALLGDLEVPPLDGFDVSTASIDNALPDEPMPEPPRAATPPPPPPPVAVDDAIGHRGALTPRTAAKLKAAARMRAETRATRKRPVQDAVTELSDGVVGPSPLVLRELRSAHELFCLPSSRMHLALCGLGLDVHADALAVGKCVRDAAGVRHAARARDPDAAARDHAEQQRWLWQVRDETQRALDEFPDEVGRRAPTPQLPDISVDERVPTPEPEKDGFDVSELPEISMDEPEAAPEAAPELPEAEAEADEPRLRRSARHHDGDDDEEHSLLPPLRSSPTPVDPAHPIAAFETRERDGSARRAADVLRQTTAAAHGAQSMHKLAAHASRRAAAGFFFELLVLGSRGSVRLEQDEPYGDIAIHATPRLWT